MVQKWVHFYTKWSKIAIEGRFSMILQYVGRQAEVDLQAWLKRANRKPLIIRGARQTGKSTLVREFARRSNLELVEINLEENQTFVRKAFDEGHLIGILSAL
jgi:MoxR-like ATPase